MELVVSHCGLVSCTGTGSRYNSLDNTVVGSPPTPLTMCPSNSLPQLIRKYQTLVLHLVGEPTEDSVSEVDKQY